MVNLFSVLTVLVHALANLAGLTPQTLELEPGTRMNVWVPKETVVKRHGRTIYVPPKKPAVLLVHSFGFDGIFIWIFQVLAFTRKYSVYVPDLLFFGGSITDRAERSVGFQAEFVGRGMEKLGVEKLTLVGLSYGGMIGFKMAKLYPNLVRSMVVSGTVMELTESISRTTHRAQGVSSWSDLLMPETIESLKRMVSGGLHKTPWTPDFVYRHMLEAMFSNRIQKNELLANWVVHDKDTTTYTNYTQVIHLLWGEDDTVFDLNHAEAIKMRLGAKTKLEYIKNAGHLVQHERPFAYNKCLKRIIESLLQDR